MNVTCSNLARTMVCAGYNFLEVQDLGIKKGADEGEAAAEYLERLLTKKPISEVSKDGLFFDDDMKFYATSVYDDILSKVNSEISCEQKINWQTASGTVIKGRYDIAYVDKKGRLCVADYKYGFGLVEVKENWQLLSYAIGEVIRRGQAFNEIVLTIYQPRAHHEEGWVRDWIISYSELLRYKEKIELRMQEITDGKKDLQTGEHCKYCKGAAEACPAFNRLFHKSLEYTTEFFQDEISDRELSQQLDHIKRAEEVLKIKKDSITELACIRIKQGKVIPGYIQTEKYSNRVWKKGITPKSLELMTGLNVIENNFMSPAKAEKAGLSKELVKELTTRMFTGIKLEKKDTTEIGNKIFGNQQPMGV